MMEGASCRDTMNESGGVISSRTSLTTIHCGLVGTKELDNVENYQPVALDPSSEAISVMGAQLDHRGRSSGKIEGTIVIC